VGFLAVRLAIGQVVLLLLGISQTPFHDSYIFIATPRPTLLSIPPFLSASSRTNRRFYSSSSTRSNVLGTATRLRVGRSGFRFPPVPMTERYKALVCSHSFDGITGSNPTGGTVVCVVCCTVQTKGENPGQPRQRNK
jgi:hypothetical protein